MTPRLEIHNVRKFENEPDLIHFVARYGHIEKFCAVRRGDPLFDVLDRFIAGSHIPQSTN